MRDLVPTKLFYFHQRDCSSCGQILSNYGRASCFTKWWAYCTHQVVLWLSHFWVGWFTISSPPPGNEIFSWMTLTSDLGLDSCHRGLLACNFSCTVHPTLTHQWKLFMQNSISDLSWRVNLKYVLSYLLLRRHIEHQTWGTSFCCT